MGHLHALHRTLLLLRAAHTFIALLACLIATGVGAAQSPVLRLDDPFVSTIWRVGLEPQGRTLVAGLSTGSLAIWNLDALGKSRLLHLPIRDEEARRAHAIAISPDGKVIAYGVPPLRNDQGFAIPSTARIYIVNGVTLRIERQIEGIASRAQDLKFSSDGEYLGAALSSGCGIRVWRTLDWTQYASDDAGYSGPKGSDKACGTGTKGSQDALPDTLSLAFANAGPVWLVSSGMSGVRTYAKGSGALSPLRFVPPEKLGLVVPDGVAISPGGKLVAIGDRQLRSPRGSSGYGVVVADLESLSASPLRLELKPSNLRFPDRVDPKVFPDARQFNLSRVAWGAFLGEEWVVGAGSFPCVAAKEESVVADRPNQLNPAELCAVGWRVDGTVGTPRFFPVGTDQANDVAISPARAILVVASDRRIASFSRNGSSSPPQHATQGWIRAGVDGAAADLRNRGSMASELLDFSVSSDASVVRLETYPSSNGMSAAIQFNVKTLTTETARSNNDEFHKPAVDDPAIEPLDAWVNSSQLPRINGRSNALGSQPWDVYRSAIALPHHLIAVSSANFLRVISYASERVVQLCALRVASEGFRLNASSDGSTIVVAHGDGTVRWYRLTLTTARDLCRLENTLSVHFRRADADRDWAWIAWMPESGEFASDPRVRSLLFWQLVGNECGTSLVSFGSLTRDLYDRGAIQTALNGPPKGPELADYLAGYCSAFKATIISPRVHARVRTAEVVFKIAVSGLSGRTAPMFVTLGGTERLAKSVDGRYFAPDKPVPLSGDGEYTLSISMPARLPTTGSDFHVCFHVQQDRDCHLLVWDGASPVPRTRQLWAVLVGIADYGLKGAADVRSLRFAQNDVIDFANLFIGDHDKQSLAAGAGTGTKVDYTQLSINLFVAPLPSSDSAKELDELNNRAEVKVGTPSASAIYEALDQMADRIRSEGTADDLFVLYFSGHGMAAPTNQVKGNSVLLLPSGQPERNFESRSEDYLDSKQLLDRLARIESSKVVVLDACRNVPFDTRAPAFDPGKMSHEFEANVPSASILFATGAGQGSIETERFFHSRSRSEDRRGNGLFSYVLLSGLTASRTEESANGYDRPDEVSIRDLADYLGRYFNRARLSDPVTFRQRPVYVPAHVAEPVFIRSIEIKSQSAAEVMQ